jgi:ribosomal protein L24
MKKGDKVTVIKGQFAGEIGEIIDIKPHTGLPFKVQLSGCIRWFDSSEIK